MMRTRQTIAMLAALALFRVVPALAQEGRQTEALVIEAQNLMAGDERHQRVKDEGGDPNALLPGDVVQYRLTFTNITDVPVRNVEFKDPVPAGLRFVGGSATADREDVSIAYSIDGGKTYSAQPMIEEMVGGVKVTRPAPPEIYTHIRWLVGGWVQPGAQVTAEFRAQLPAEAHEEPGEQE
jgi:uncharacterized repeat protein (TIGR01451 family)